MNKEIIDADEIIISCARKVKMLSSRIKSSLWVMGFYSVYSFKTELVTISFISSMITLVSSNCSPLHACVSKTGLPVPKETDRLLCTVTLTRKFDLPFSHAHTIVCSPSTHDTYIVCRELDLVYTKTWNWNPIIFDLRQEKAPNIQK